MSSKKGQGLSLSTIVIAALVLVVLVILVMLTTGYFGKWMPSFHTLSNTSCKGTVVDEKADCGPDERENYAAEVTQGKKCCVITKD